MNKLKQAQIKNYLTKEIRKENIVNFFLDGIEVWVHSYGQKETPITAEGRLRFPKLAHEQDISFSKPISFKCRAFSKTPFVGCGGFRYVDSPEEGADEVMQVIARVEKVVLNARGDGVVCWGW